MQAFQFCSLAMLALERIVVDKTAKDLHRYKLKGGAPRQWVGATARGTAAGSGGPGADFW